MRIFLFLINNEIFFEYFWEILYVHIYILFLLFVTCYEFYEFLNKMFNGMYSVCAAVNVCNVQIGGSFKICKNKCSWKHIIGFILFNYFYFISFILGHFYFLHIFAFYQLAADSTTVKVCTKSFFFFVTIWQKWQIL